MLSLLMADGYFFFRMIWPFPAKIILKKKSIILTRASIPNLMVELDGQWGPQKFCRGEEFSGNVRREFFNSKTCK